jgi:hypothetical protein
MGGAERVRRLFHDPADFLQREWAAPADSGGHRFAIHVPHHKVDQTLAFADGMDRDYVGMR